MRRFRSIAITALVGIIGGAAFPLFFYGLRPQTILNGIIVGLFISFSITFIERSILEEQLRRMRFSFALGIRTAVQMLTIVLSVALGDIIFTMLSSKRSLGDVFEIESLRRFLFGSEMLMIVLYAITLSFLVNMIRQMSRMLGQNVLLNMMVGKYSSPIEEDRVFMFLDLNASTTIAERIGNVRYHELLDDYVYDITKQILVSHGEIYQYVGDEVVVTWKVTGATTTMDCIDCFFRISEAMEAVSGKYQERYGFVPGFKAGFHYGTVVAGQIGDIKREIVFQGDVVNTASRIKETCTSLGAKILISRELLEILPQTNTPYRALRVGSFLLKGKEHEVELFSVAKLPAA
ncbi:MAG: adenylate/guanylate cyclase domain-containing protein [Ignavibacteriota bacterium]